MSRAEPTVFERLAPRPEAVDAALAGVEDACFWQTDVSVDRRPRLTGDHHADLAVVGGGYTGLWTAVRAKERDPGRRVVLLEARRLGWAASGRNGGFCSDSLTHGEDNGRQRWPSEYDVLERLGQENLAGIEKTVARHGMDVDLERTGELSVAVEPHQVAWLEEMAASGHGRLLSQDEVRREVASPTYLAGHQADDTALLHPVKMVRELARVAEDLGVEVLEDSPVTGLDAGPSGQVSVVTDGGTVRADRVALGTNVFPALLRRHRAFTIPVYDYAVMTEPLSAAQKDAIGWRNRQGLDDLANHFHYYRLSADDRILFGGYDAVYRFGKRVRAEHEHRPESHRKLVSHLLTTFPQLEGIRVTHRWAGAIDTSTRFCAFYALALRGRVAHAAGFTGLGVGATRFAADVMLDLLDGEETERTSLEMVRRLPVPFPPEPLASAGIQATRWALDRADHRRGRRNLWLRSLDRLGLGFDS
ncbi:NAD(P)/FAD-dependent oxidoreductase [Nocardioides marmoribigeumensis]|uniref:Glycine/D-amino acid oxidase-like deaminating enzyme n=1 Tax=Nocardioides marmoribigeumensis TaxID=433649 RepID=A0ABU2BSF9_9ACTN|nr:FAD-dependent oxidoreductase [Nocardioides marmoribigeumensis]MDR7361582.1 glycine/D-amino acid oxidase-like deaminating enzyme [Nocardioides marmoribigeumensis]